jgi:hypothetical protein
MTSIENHKKHLLPFFESYFKTDNFQKLQIYLINNSNLPSPRGNLELAKAFADLVKDNSSNQSEKLWQLCSEFIKITAEQAPTNNPMEFVAFCGAEGIGAIGSVSPQYFKQTLLIMKVQANDSRWRMREGVCFGLQRLMAGHGMAVIEQFEEWLDNATLLELRVIAGSVADPPLLKDNKLANAALALHKEIFKKVLIIADRKSENFRILRKALGFTLSVVVRATPEPGFEFMRQLVNSKDADVRWILKENLKKNRLTKNFPEQVESLKKLLLEK